MSGVDRGGGVLLALKKNIKSSLVGVVNRSNFDVLFVKFRIKTKKYVVSTVYIPSGSGNSVYLEYTDLLDDVINQHPDHTFILSGDFNLPSITWDPKTCQPSLEKDNECAKTLICSMEFHELSQHNFVLNYANQVILDLVFTNKPQSIKVSSCVDHILKIDSNHPPLLIEIFNTTAKKFHHKVVNNNETVIIRDFKSGDYFNLCSHLNDNFNDCTFFNPDSDLETLVDSFYSIIHNGIQTFIPEKTLKSPKFPIWFSPELKQLIIDKKKAHIRYKRSGCPHHYNYFSNIRSKCKETSSVDYRTYMNKIEHSISTEPKKLWKFVKSKKENSNIPAVMNFENLSSQDLVSTANLFARNFSNNFSNSTCPINDLSHLYSTCFNIVHLDVSPNEVCQLLNSLPYHACRGPDEISPIFFKRCARVLAAPLTLLFQRSLDSGVFPKRWKKSYVSPIFKSGDKHDVKNYRPVSITSIIPKFLENLVSRKLYPILSSIISDHQHGFLMKRSTTTNLVSFTQYITNALESGDQVDVIYTDFSKCFDKINHKLLLAKLKAIGIDGSLLKWLDSFHSNRTQVVKLNSSEELNGIFKNVYSQPISVTSGCIQGGHMSGILFLCFINDIVSIFPPWVQAWLFADDLKIAMRVRSAADTLALQKVIVDLHQWCIKNHMELNIAKCKVLTFHTIRNPYIGTYHIDNTVLERVSQIKDLGVTFGQNLKFNNHFENIRSKAFQMLGFLYRHTRDFTSPTTLKTLYYAYVRSRVEYCSSVWSPKYQVHIKSIEAVQRKFLRMLAYKCGTRILDHDYTPILNDHNIMTLEQRRDLNDLVFLMKLIQNQIYSPELLQNLNFKLKSRATRNKAMFNLYTFKTNIGEFSPLNRMQSMGNKATDVGLDIFVDSLSRAEDVVRGL